MANQNEEKENHVGCAATGAKGTGDFYRVELNPAEEFLTFRYHDVGQPGHIERLAGQRWDGSWETHAWLISKQDAHLEGDELVGDSEDAREILRKQLRSTPTHVQGDVFRARGIPSVHEK